MYVYLVACDQFVRCPGKYFFRDTQSNASYPKYLGCQLLYVMYASAKHPPLLFRLIRRQN